MMVILKCNMMRPVIIAIKQLDADLDADLIDADLIDGCVIDDEYGELVYTAYVPKNYTAPNAYYDTDEDGNNNYEFMKDPDGLACWKRICERGETLYMKYCGHHDVTDRYLWIVMGPDHNDIWEICLTENDMECFIETPYRRQRQIYRIRCEEI